MRGRERNQVIKDTSTNSGLRLENTFEKKTLSNPDNFENNLEFNSLHFGQTSLMSILWYLGLSFEYILKLTISKNIWIFFIFQMFPFYLQIK